MTKQNMKRPDMGPVNESINAYQMVMEKAQRNLATNLAKGHHEEGAEDMYSYIIHAAIDQNGDDLNYVSTVALCVKNVNEKAWPLLRLMLEKTGTANKENSLQVLSSAIYKGTGCMVIATHHAGCRFPEVVYKAAVKQASQMKTINGADLFMAN